MNQLPDLTILSPQEKDELIHLEWKIIQDQDQQIKKQDQRILKLEFIVKKLQDRLLKNSGNSTLHQRIGITSLNPNLNEIKIRRKKGGWAERPCG